MRNIRVRLMDENGAVLIAVLGIFVVFTAFGIALSAGVDSNFQLSERDRYAKRAVAVAEAGIEEASYRLNMLQPTAALPCVSTSNGQLVLVAAPGSGQWCSAQTVTLGSGETASYRISPYVYDDGIVTRTIVSTGTVNGVTRRVSVLSSANTGAPLFDPYGLASDKTLTLAGNANITGAIRSNNDIDMSGNAKVCGTNSGAVPGPGKNVNLTGNASVCGTTVPAASPFVLTPVDQGDAATNNDNGRFFTQDTKVGSVSWSSSTRQLSLSSNQTLTLGGHTYSMCKLTISGNAQLIIASAAIVRIYIDSPANCGLAATSQQLSISGNGKLINTSQLPDHLQIYMAGSGLSATNTASFSGNAVTTQMSFYAPYTSLTISGNGSTYSGAMVAQQISISGNGASVAYDSRVESITQTTIGIYSRQKFIECTPATGGSDPDSGC